MTEHAVVIAGGGPDRADAGGRAGVGGDRRRHRRTAAPTRTSTARAPAGCTPAPSRCSTSVASPNGSSPRARPHPGVGFAGIPLDISDFPTRHNYVLALWQSHIEPILADWVAELGVPILREREVVGFAQDDTGVDVELSGRHVAAGGLPRRLRRRAQPGPQGGGHRLRRVGSVDQLDDRRGRDGRGAGARHAARGRRHPARSTGEAASRIRVVLIEREVEHTRRAHPGRPARGARRRLRDRLRGAQPTWISRFTDMARQAASYRQGRVLLAGDAAHVHPPQGGQGLNTGVQDAVNLGWKLAQVVNGTSPESLLDTYHAERHPVGARVLHNTMAQVALGRPDDRHQALRDTMTELLGMDEPRRRIAGMMSGLDIHYDLGEGHPLLGRRMPDLDLRHRRRSHPRLRPAARRPAGAARPRRARRLRHRPLGGSGPAGRRHPRRACGSSRSSARSPRPTPC